MLVPLGFDGDHLGRLVDTLILCQWWPWSRAKLAQLNTKPGLLDVLCSTITDWLDEGDVSTIKYAPAYHEAIYSQSLHWLASAIFLWVTSHKNGKSYRAQQQQKPAGQEQHSTGERISLKSPNSIRLNCGNKETATFMDIPTLKEPKTPWHDYNPGTPGTQTAHTS